ncbi:hypothetical protein XENOCAPTIV_015089, partial [Xenoophorus captivus]
MAFYLASAVSTSPIAAISVSKYSFQQDHGINSSPGRARTRGRGEKESAIFVANVVPDNEWTMIVFSKSFCLLARCSSDTGLELPLWL